MQIFLRIGMKTPKDTVDWVALRIQEVRTSNLGSNKVKKISVTSHEGPQGRETSRLPHFLDNQLTDGGEVVSLIRRPPFTPRKVPSTHFC
jgi:hypothetical protein